MSWFPHYFIAEDEDGEKEALHHVRDAEEISDVIRQARVDEDGNRIGGKLNHFIRVNSH